MLKKILVPLDGSSLAETALPHAITLARRTNATIYLIRVVKEQGNPATNPPNSRVVTEYMAQKVSTVHDEGIPVQSIIRSGNAAEQIVYRAAALQVDVIVMATHGRSGLQRLFLGSVADQIVRKAECPVFLIHGAVPVRPYRTIVVPLDGTLIGESVLPVAATLARAYHARLILIHTLPILSEGDPALNPMVAMASVHEYYYEDADKMRDYLNKVAAPLKHSGLAVETVCCLGNPKEILADYVQSERPDLLVMATHTNVPVERALLGSVADYTLHHVDVPIMLYRYRGPVIERSEPVAHTVAPDEDRIFHLN